MSNQVHASNEYPELHPAKGSIYDHRLESAAGQLADVTHKRVAGGRVQFGLMKFGAIAEAIVPLGEGYDKRSKSKYDKKQYVLWRILADYGFPQFDRAIVIALVRKYCQDPKDGFIPLGPGTTDIEAGLQPEGPHAHRELSVFGVKGEPDEKFASLVNSKIGLVTEYGNGDSLELAIPVYTPGEWKNIVDLEFKRSTGMLIVAPQFELWCEGMSINGLQLAVPNPSVKVTEALKTARQIIREMNIG